MYALGHMCAGDRDRVFAVFALASHRYASGLASLDWGDSTNGTYEAAARHIVSTWADFDIILFGRGLTRAKGRELRS